MKMGLLRYDPKNGNIKNIGDYVQSMAAKQFLNSEPILVEREGLHEYKGENIKLIMNAWWMHCPDNWPPSDNINPLFISFHITPKAASKLLVDKSISYLKKYEPIGCRDKGTQKILEESGVKTYFSGCLTLTLGKSYKSDPKPENVIIVNPHFYRPTLKNPYNFIKSFIYSLNKFNLLKKISKKLYLSDSFISVLKTSYFYRVYRKKFDDSLLSGSSYVSHGVDVSQFTNEEQRFDYTDELLKKYSSASLVITSRLHAALPCVGMGVPTIFVYGDDIPRSSGRFDGLLEHVNCLQYVNGVWKGLNGFECMGEIGFTTEIVNKNTHLNISNEMMDRVKSFIEES